MKKLLLLTTLITFVLGVSAQTAVFEDDFESYTAGSGIATQTDNWETWSGGSGGSEDAIVSDDYAMSGSNSMLVEGTNDMIYQLGGETSGVYKVEFNYFMESGYGGYYNFQHTFGADWAFAVFFSDDGTGYLEVGGETYDLDYPQDTWFKIENYVNLDEDEAMLYVDGVHVHTWEYGLLEAENSTVDTPTLDVVNFYAASEDPATPKYYVDDFNYLEGELVFGDGFESPYVVGTGVADQSDDWTTWSGGTGGAEDALVSDAFAHMGTQSMNVTGTNDMVYELGGQTSGVFDINFWYYMESGFGGYYNLQHAFGSTWAMEVYFSDDGTGYLSADAQEIDLTYPQDEWFYVENRVDLDADMAYMYINGEMVHEWVYSQEPDGTDVADPMLDVVNFYAAAEEPASPNYYVDDFEYWIAETGLLPPTVAVDTEELLVYETGDGVDPEVITIENMGEQTMNFEVYPVYPLSDDNALTEIEEIAPSNKKSLKRAETTAAASETVISFDPNQRDGTLTHVVSELGSGIGYASEVDVRAAAKFRPMDVEPFIGMMIEEVIVYHAYAPMNGEGTLKIWDRGETTTPGPGALIYEKEYSAPDAGQFTVSVDEDIYVTGKDLWVGYEITDPGDGVFPIGMDAGPQEPGVNFTSTGPGWSEMTGDDYGNIGVIVELVGDGMPSWMSITPSSGTIEAGGSEEILVDFMTAGMDNGVYVAEIHIAANDPGTNYTAIPVVLDISTAIIDGTEEQVGVMTYPNPAVDNLNVKSNDLIESVKVINNIGQVVFESTPNAKSLSIKTSNYDKGMYMIQVQTVNSETITQKVVIK